PAVHQPRRHGPGQCPVLAVYAGFHPAGRGRAVGRPARLAGHQRLAPDRSAGHRGPAERAGLNVRSDIIVEVKIGIQSSPRELVVETDGSGAEVEKILTEALGAAEEPTFALTTRKGVRGIGPADKIAFEEFDVDKALLLVCGNR